MSATRPTAWQLIRYSYGAKLPDTMRAWVTHDLSGQGAAARMVGRWAVPCLLLITPMFFVPADLLVKLNMAIPIIVPYIFFSMALNRVYRRHRLVQHGLDPELVHKRERERNADLYDEYHRKYRGA